MGWACCTAHIALKLARHSTHLVILSIESADEHVVGDVVKVTSVLQPGPSHGDVVCCALALGLDQDEGVIDLVAQGLEGRQDLQSLAVRGDSHLHVLAWAWRLVCLLTYKLATSAPD